MTKPLPHPADAAGPSEPLSPRTTIDTPALSAGQRVGGYELVDKLGTGGFAEVWRARQQSPQRMVALKLLLVGTLEDEEDVERHQEALRRFRTEAEAVAGLDHPNILPIYEVGELRVSDEVMRPYFSMRLVQGCDLAESIRSGRWPTGNKETGRRAAGLMATLAQAVHHAHQRGILHRDLKPQNILLDLAADKPPEQAIAYVSDFGLARRLERADPQTVTGQVLGTMSYMAPEQARAEKNVTTAADVYGLGTILYELLTNRPPFTGANAYDVWTQVLEKEPLRPRELHDGLDRDLETVCLKCLDKDPARRYGSAEALAEDLERWLRNEPIHARPHGPWFRLSKFARRNKLLVGSLAAVVLAILIGTGGTLAAAWRALEEGRERQRLLAESYVQNARTASQRGQWAEALENYNRALQEGYPDSVALRLDRVRALMALNEDEQAQEDIDNLLASGRDLGEHQGTAHLLLGELLLGRDNQRGLQLIRQALTEPLPDVDRFYGEALVARRTVQAVPLFRRVLKEDPYHLSAHQMLAVLLLSLGRFQEASEQIARCKALYPDDSNTTLLDSVLPALQGNVAETERRLREASAPLPPDLQAVIRSVAQALEELRQVDLLDSEKTAQLLVNKLWPAVERLMEMLRRKQGQDIRGADGTRRIVVRTPPVFHALTSVVEEMPKNLMGVKPQNLWALVAQPQAGWEQFLDKITASLIEIHPIGELRLMRGSLLFGNGKYVEAEQELLLGLDSELHFMKPRDAHVLLMACRGLQGSAKNKNPDLKKRKQAVEHLRQLLAEGPLHAPERLLGVKVARSAEEHDLARLILGDWERAEPGNGLPLALRATIEWRLDNPEGAVRLLQKAVQMSPDDGYVKEAVQQAPPAVRERLQKKP